MEITQDYLAECFTYDPTTGVLTWKKRPLSHFKNAPGMRVFNSRFAGMAAGSRNRLGYTIVRVGGKGCGAHRLIWLLQTRAWPPEDIDHVDGDKSNNRFANLRAVSHAKNMKNTTLCARNTSGTVGVSWYKPPKKWRAQIQVSGRSKHLGYFTNKAEAITARKAAEAKYKFHPNHGRTA